MTLHNAIEKVLKNKKNPMTTSEIALELNKNKWYEKKDGSEITAFQIHGRTRKYPNLFDRQGSSVSLLNESSPIKKNSEKRKKPKIESSEIKNTDEKYVIDLCDKILKQTSSRQHRFDFLLGDPNRNGISAKLPVDAFYPKLNFVVEYREKQHTENVGFFDKPNKITVSGVHRGEQRKIYDNRREEILPEHGIKLIKISYTDFDFDRKKRIIRNEKSDIEKIKSILASERKNGR